jgi:hypothetical protein
MVIPLGVTLMYTQPDSSTFLVLTLIKFNFNNKTIKIAFYS